MKIQSIKLKNGYKRFHDLTIDLGPTPARIVALVGSNGCGKSSVFDGMLFLQNAYQRIGSTGTKDHTYHSMKGDPNFNHTNVDVTFADGPFVSVYKAQQLEGKENTIFSFRSPYRYNSSLKVTETRATTELRLNNYGASSTNAIDEKMEENYRRLFAMYNRQLENTDCRPSEAKAKIIGDLNQSLKRCLDISVANLGNIEDNQGSLYFGKSDQHEPFEFDVLSAGEKEVVDILLDLYLRKDEYSDTVFLIDEPELHINTSIQKNLLLEINNLIGPNCQVWVATHSIGLLRALQDDLKEDCQVIYFEPRFNFASEERVLRPIQKNHRNWRRIFETALDDLTGLVSPQKIIYCEGKDKPVKGEEGGLDARVYNTIFGENYPETLFVSSGGNTELDQRSDIAISILSKVFSGLKILVLKDRDFASGKITTEDDRITYLKDNPSNHRIIKRLEIENYLYSKEVLILYCQANDSTFNEAGYDALVTNIMDQDVKSRTGQIKKICGITNSLNVEKFKLQLAKGITPEMEVYSELVECIFNV